MHAAGPAPGDPTRPAAVAAVCPTVAVAEAALAALDVDLADAAIVVRANGRVELHQTRELAPGEGVVAGGTAGLVAGMLLGGPVAGALLGMLGGGAWSARDTGIDDARLRALGETLPPGDAAVCALVQPDAAPHVRDVLAGYGAVVDVPLP